MIRASNATVYKWGDRIAFGLYGNAGPFLGLGWSEQADETSTWTNGPEADFSFRSVPPPSDIVMTFHVFPFLCPGIIEQQALTIFFNYYRVGYFEIDRASDHSVHLPRELFAMRTAKLCFHIPTCESPQKLKLNQDVRRLGLAFESIVLEPTT
jgi:hypothetical protein